MSRPGPNEKQFQAAVVQLAKLLGWEAYHTLYSRGSESGFPDLVLASRKQRRLIFRELKVGTKVPTPKQRHWLDLLEAAGGDVGVWRPDDWPRIEKELKG